MGAAGVPPPQGWSGPGAYAAQVPSPPPASPHTAEPWAQWPYGTGQTYRSGQGLATALTVLLTLMAVLSIARVWTHTHRASLVDDVRNGNLLSIDLRDLSSADDMVSAASALFALGVLATGVVFIVWQYRHAVNARALAGRSDGPGLGPGWAIGGWFIPFANLVLPGAQIYGSSRASDPAVPPRAGVGAGSGIVVLWAVVLGVGSVVERYGTYTYPDWDDVGQLGGFEEFVADGLAADRVVAVGAAAYAVAAVLAIVMVRRLTARQDHRAAAMAMGGRPGAPGHAGQPAPGVPSVGWAPQTGSWAPPPAPPAPPAWSPSPWAPPGDVR